MNFCVYAGVPYFVSAAQAKSSVAAAAALAINPKLKIRALQNRVGPETENVFDDEFWSSLDVVVNALDNVNARLYVDYRCVYFQKPLLESGTLGPKCNTQVVMPNETENYGASRYCPAAPWPSRRGVLPVHPCLCLLFLDWEHYRGRSSARWAQVQHAGRRAERDGELRCLQVLLRLLVATLPGVLLVHMWPSGACSFLQGTSGEAGPMCTVHSFPVNSGCTRAIDFLSEHIVADPGCILSCRDPPEKQAPMCTVHSFPHNIDHCLTWARSEFEGLLGKTPGT